MSNGNEINEKRAEELLALGERLIASLEAAEADAEPQLESYVACFDQWYGGLNRNAHGELVFSELDAELGGRVAEQHARIISLVDVAAQDVKRSLGELRGWSKGIRAYVDHLPKSVSTIKTRKG
jgi:hypothetical protein